MRDSTSLSKEAGHFPQGLTSSNPLMIQEGESPQIPSSGGACLPDPGSLAYRSHPATTGGGTAEFVTYICPPLCGPHNFSRIWCLT